ncbi:hypothetical protein E4T56_gene1592 [Termitomyces sp. T112]|nr:hypothetical protein E4T56_gene1592 [Termitomyces sp. T112]
MFFRFTNSPATFQTMMNDIFQDLITGGIVCIYLNDILIYAKTLEEHCQITCLGMPPSSLALSQTREVAAEMDPVKVVGVVECPEPKNKKEVQAFLGFANFYRRFIQDFLHHACSLFDLTAKDTA